MALPRITSPHAHGPMSTARVMQWVLLATIPGIWLQTLFFGWGTLTNIAFAAGCCAAMEAVALRMRGRPVAFYLSDYSAMVTAVLLGIALPPGSPWWLIATGCLFAIIVAKHMYGGMGYNPFNPAMVAYVVLLISFPVEMTWWLAPQGIFEGELMGPVTALQSLFRWFGEVDAVTMATPLDLLKQNSGQTMADLYSANPQFSDWGGVGWQWVNLGFLAGGLFLLYKRLFTWHAPVGMLLTLVVMAALFHDNGSSASGGSVSLHLFSGATMLGAFFIVTDPVSSATSNRGRLVFGIGVGLLVYLIRTWGNYPDAIAFAVLLMNFAAPTIDHFTQPRTYGHAPKSVLKRGDDDAG